MKSLEMAWSNLSRAFSKRTLSLLGNQHARFYLALFDVTFETPNSMVEYEELCSRINIAVSEFADDPRLAALCPQENDQPKRADSLLRTLVDEYRWISKEVMSDGTVSCRLTADAREAILTVGRLNKSQTLMSGSRMKSVIDASERAKLELSDDYEMGLRNYEERLERLTRERDEYVATHGASGRDVEAIQDIVYNIHELIAPMSTDISQYEATLNALNVQFRKELAAGVGKEGTLTRRHYDERVDESLHNSRESYRDAVRVKASYEHGDDIFMALREIDNRASQLADTPLPVLSADWQDVTDSIRRVSSTESRSSMLVDNALAHMMSFDGRELTRALARLEQAVLKWAEVTPVRGETDFDGFVSGCRPLAMATELGEPLVDPIPPSITYSKIDDSDFDTRQFREYAPPRPLRLKQRLLSLTPAGEAVTGAFNALSEEERRVCELFGLLELVAHGDGQLSISDEFARWHLVDPSGQEVVWVSRSVCRRKDGFE